MNVVKLNDSKYLCKAQTKMSRAHQDRIGPRWRWADHMTATHRTEPEARSFFMLICISAFSTEQSVRC